jgi:hypothetical protein
MKANHQIGATVRRTVFCALSASFLTQVPSLREAAADLPAPTLSSPANGNTGQSTTPTFSSSAVSRAASYRIIVATNVVNLPGENRELGGGKRQCSQH